jgi:murein DD-endopeptidase MepM/ murein hydrolase activator NlpD
MLKSSKRSLFFIVLFLILLGYVSSLFFYDMTSPEISFSHTSEYIAPNIPITIIANDAKSPIKSIKVTALYNGKVIPIVENFFSDPLHTQQITFTLEETGIKDSLFDLEVTATDNPLNSFGFFSNKITQIYTMRMDTTPLRIIVKSTIPYMRRGGTGCIVYSINKNVQQTGIKVGSLFFPAFRQANDDYLCFFAFPYNMGTKEYQPLLAAVDLAGNTQINELSISRIHRQFKADNIEITQNFLDSKSAEFANILPTPMSDIKRFLTINSEIRANNTQRLMEIGKNTDSEMLWKGSFLRMPMSALRAGFADHRTYIWEGKKIDEQTHLGFDLASTKNSPIPAANNGRVAYTGYLGIYGNLVVLDHGLGIQSLYSHLSEIHVHKDQMVMKGDIIGKTGTTGMSAGDHLHFGMLASGVEVTPLEWLDEHWIKDNIIDRIKATGNTAPEFTVTTPVEKPATHSRPHQRKNKTATKRKNRK